ncbi:MAG: Myb-like DNA-binding domain containing protein [Candidatus Paraimprobicoccus trichonymphae]|uniref:Myb-like DNA-binding domain containing protein n=1 Tax=Candidatus Paraimprobicoccus trichonymphae TaxID=3033793 RepID=A0AA48KXY6_9FIRM|nr:MAG: Myb-like DNA-binding domain containing protein [Candidatus Paraimprobicoccus trichonymphae]
MKKRKIASFMACLFMGGAFLGNVYGCNFVFNKKHDTILTNIIETHGTKDWTLNVKEFEKKLSDETEKKNFYSLFDKFSDDLILKKKVRRLQNRWNNFLKPKKEKFSIEEDELILSLVSKHGSKWKIIKKSFSKRTADSIKYRYLNHLMKASESRNASESTVGIEFPKFNDFFNDFFNKATDESSTTIESPWFNGSFNENYETTNENSTTSEFPGFNEFEENFFHNL